MSKLKEVSIKRINEIVRRYSPNNLPSCSSKDEQERKDYGWIMNKTKAKYGKGEGRWFNEIEEIAKEHGFHDLFISHEDKFKNRVEKFCKKYSKIGFPKLTGKNEDVYFLMHLKKLQRQNSKSWTPEIEKIIKKYNLNLKTGYSNKDASIKRLHNIMSEYSPNDLPKRNRNGKKNREHQDAIWIFHMRAAKRGTGKYIWYPELEKIAEQNGFKGLFDRKRLTNKNY